MEKKKKKKKKKNGLALLVGLLRQRLLLCRFPPIALPSSRRRHHHQPIPASVQLQTVCQRQRRRQWVVVQLFGLSTSSCDWKLQSSRLPCHSANSRTLASLHLALVHQSPTCNTMDVRRRSAGTSNRCAFQNQSLSNPGHHHRRRRLLPTLVLAPPSRTVVLGEPALVIVRKTLFSFAPLVTENPSNATVAFKINPNSYLLNPCSVLLTRRICHSLVSTLL